MSEEPFRRVRGFDGVPGFKPVEYVPTGQLVWPNPYSRGWLQYEEWRAEGNEPDPPEEKER